MTPALFHFPIRSKSVKRARNASRWLIGKPVPPAFAGDLVPRFAPDQETRFANAMRAETLFGDVDHGVASGFWRNAAGLPRWRKERDGSCRERPTSDRRVELALIHLVDRTRPVLGGHITVRLVAETITASSEAKR